MSYLKRKQKRNAWTPAERMSNSVIEILRSAKRRSQSAWARIPASHCTALWFCCWKTWSYFRRRRMLLSVLIIRRLSLSLSLRAVLQRRSTRWELCYRSALESVRLSTGQKVRLYRGLMLLYKECRKKKERKEKEILISPSRIAVRFERLQFVFVFYFIIFYYIFLAHLKSKDVVVVVASRTWPFVCTFCSTSRVSICCDSGSCVMGTILLFSSSFFLSLLRKKKVVTLDGPTRRNKTKERGRRSGIYRIARKYGNPRQRYRAVSPSLFPVSVRRWWGPSISFLLSFFFARGGGGGALMLRKCTVFI